MRDNGAVASVTRRDVEHTKNIDRIWGDHQGVLLARMKAVVGAQRALAAGETGARYALRQGLVDLAAAAELVAGEMVAVERTRAARRTGWNNG